MKRLGFGILAIAAVAGACVAGTAIAAERTEAILAAPVSEPRQVIVDGKLWSCEGNKCTSGNQGKSQPIGRECARAAKTLGPIVAYTRGERALNADEIKACNAQK